MPSSPTIPGLDLHGLPLGLICVAVVDRATDDSMRGLPWFDDYDVVLVSPTTRPRARSMPAAHNARSSSPATAPAAAVAGQGGRGCAPELGRSATDRRPARDPVAAARRGMGRPSFRAERSEGAATARPADPRAPETGEVWSSWAVARDRAVADPRADRCAGAPSQVNALWQIGRPDHAQVEAYDREDVCFVASDQLAASIGRYQSTARVVALRQATIRTGSARGRAARTTRSCSSQTRGKTSPADASSTTCCQRSTSWRSTAGAGHR